MQFGVYRLGKAAKETNRAFSAPQHTQRAIRRIYLPRKGSDIARRACRVYKGAFQPKLGGDDVEAFCERQAGTHERSPFCPNAYGLEADKELILAMPEAVCGTAFSSAFLLRELTNDKGRSPVSSMRSIKMQDGAPILAPPQNHKNQLLLTGFWS